MKKVGLVIGTFAPLHIGHISNITRSIIENDYTIIVVSGYEGDRGDLEDSEIFKKMDVKNRYKNVKEYFKEEDTVSVQLLDETHIARYPNGWQAWIDEVSIRIDNVVNENENLQNQIIHIVNYMGETEYILQYKYYRPTWENVLVDRVHPVSATLIRNNPVKYRILAAYTFYKKKRVLERAN